MKLRVKLPLVLIPLIIGPLIVVGWVALDRMRADAEEKMLDQMATLIEQIAVNAEAADRTATANARLFSGSGLLKTFIFTSFEDRYHFALLPLMKLFGSYNKAYPDYGEIRIVLPDGYEDARFSSTGTPNRTENEADSSWFRAMEKAQKQTYSAFQWNPDTGEPTTVVAHRLMFIDPTFEDSTAAVPSFRGYLAITVGLENLRAQVAGARIGKHGGILILDKSGRPLFPDVQSIALTDPEMEALLPVARSASAENNTVPFKSAKKPLLIRARPLPGGLMLIGYLPEDELAEAGEYLARVVFAIGIGAVFVTVGLLMLVLQILIVKPLRELGAGAEAIGSGNLETRLAVRGRDEVALLASQFNNMAEGLAESRRLRDEAQAETLRLKEDAINSLRTADQLKDEFLANTSHELRTPLHGITGLAESLVKGIAGTMPELAQENLRLIIASGQRLTNLVNDILDFSKLKHKSLKLVLRPVELRSACDLVFSMLRVLAEPKGIKLKNRVADNLPMVMADENRLHQILYNLIGNAVKFTDKGHVVVGAANKGDTIEIIVEDTGIGIPETEREIIFKSFEQLDGGLDRAGAGTGLGLAITRQLVENHGGTIEVNERDGGGSRFFFTLPCAIMNQRINDQTQLEDNRIAPDSARDHSTLKFGPKKSREPVNAPLHLEHGHILVVDDEPVNLRVIENHLRLNGYRVTAAASGAEAQVEIDKNEDNLDMILLDVMMPGQSGYLVCETLRQTYTQDHLPIIFLTALTRDSDLERGFSVGGNDYLPKPFSYVELLARIRLHLTLSRQSRDLQMLNSELEMRVRERTVALERAYADMEQLANLDGLTGVSNRRALDQALEAAWTESCRTNGPLSYVIMDIDHFKAFNDTYGHPAGDDCLHTVAKGLGRIAEQYNGFLGRYGGEEFCLLLPLSASDAFAAAEAARREIESLALSHLSAPSGIVTLSAGISSRSTRITSPEILINAADRALYRAKQNSRNRTEMFDENSA